MVIRFVIVMSMSSVILPLRAMDDPDSDDIFARDCEKLATALDDLKDIKFSNPKFAVSTKIGDILGINANYDVIRSQRLGLDIVHALVGNYYQALIKKISEDDYTVDQFGRWFENYRQETGTIVDTLIAQKADVNVSVGFVENVTMSSLFVAMSHNRDGQFVIATMRKALAAKKPLNSIVFAALKKASKIPPFCLRNTVCLQSMMLDKKDGGATSPFGQNRFSLTPLMAAVSYQNEVAAQSLLAARAHVHSREYLRRAVSNRNPAMIDILVNAKAPVNSEPSAANNHFSLLAYACVMQSPQCLERLFAAGARVHAKDQCGPLAAMMYGCVNVTEKESRACVALLREHYDPYADTAHLSGPRHKKYKRWRDAVFRTYDRVLLRSSQGDLLPQEVTIQKTLMELDIAESLSSQEPFKNISTNQDFFKEFVTHVAHYACDVPYDPQEEKSV